MDANNWEAHNCQIKPFLTKRRTINVERRKFAQWQLTRPLTETTTSPRQSPSQSV